MISSPRFFSGLIVVVASVLVGCTTTAPNEQSDRSESSFRIQSPDYILSPAPTREHVDFLLNAHEATIRDIVAVLRKRLEEDPGRVEETLTFLENYDWERLFRSAAGEGDHLERMQEGDRLYFFRYTHPSSRFMDEGYLILRDGEIVFRDPHDETGDRNVLEVEGTKAPFQIDKL